MNALIRPRFEKSDFLEWKGTESSAMQGPGNEDKNTLWNPPKRHKVRKRADQRADQRSDPPIFREIRRFFGRNVFFGMERNGIQNNARTWIWGLKCPVQLPRTPYRAYRAYRSQIGRNQYVDQETEGNRVSAGRKFGWQAPI